MTATLSADGRRIQVAICRGMPINPTCLERLARALWAGRTRAVLDAAGAASEPAALGWRAEAYVAGRAGIVARGRSRDGSVAVETVGMRQWRVHIQPGAGGAAVEEAGEELLRDQARQIRALKRTIWQPGGTGNACPAAESGVDVPRPGGSQ
ncbi:hypothetical protein [Dactylosporangium sp. CA-139066]|uniref:hypothetical protein n=1 Tax=Dactylosporangium sp. CA-139066 TaxID=3239930 RepID=UPI003D94EE77